MPDQKVPEVAILGEAQGPPGGHLTLRLCQIRLPLLVVFLVPPSSFVYSICMMPSRQTWTLVGFLFIGGLSASACVQSYDSGVSIPLLPLAGVEAETHPQYRGDPTHVGVAPSGTNLGDSLTLNWKSEALAIGDYTASKSSPAVDDDSVYIGVDDGRLHALDKESGAILWSFETNRFESEKLWTGSDHRGIHGTPAVDDERVYIGDYDGYMYAVDKETGTLEWSSRIGHSVGASPVLYGDFVFIAVEFRYPDGQVFVLDAETGKTIWSTPALGNHPHSSVTIDPERGYFFVGANNGLFFCFDFVSKTEVWRVQTDDAIKSTAAVDGDTVYITSWDHKLYAIDIDSGRERFTVESQSRSMSSPSVFDGRVYFGSHDSKLYAVDADNGEELWVYDTGARIVSSPTVVEQNGLVVVGSKDKRVHLVDQQSGSGVQRLDLGSFVSSVPVATGAALFVNDDSGTLWRFDAQ